MVGRSIVVGVALALGLVGCTSAEPGDAPPSKVTHPKAEIPQDRDERAVLGALRRLDFCALLESAVRGALESPTDVSVRPRRPAACVVSADSSSTGDRVSIDAEVTELDSARRGMLPSPTLGGAKAYVERRAVCDVYLPVSFRLALKFLVDSTADQCQLELAQQLVAAAARTLANPAAVDTRPRWDACELLDVATGGKPHQGAVGAIVGDACQTADFSSSITLEYFPFGGGRGSTKDSVGGKEVWVTDDQSSCSVEWQAGPPAGESEDGLVARMSGSTCAQAKTFAGTVMATLRKPPPADVAPQQPLLYRPDEADMPRPGACRHAALLYPNEGPEQDHCEPYVKVSVPRGREEILRAAAADLNVTCALAVDPITERFGTELKPVTVSGTVTEGACYFVEALHRVQIVVTVSPDPVDERAHGPVADLRRTELAGRRGYVDPEADCLTCRMLVSMSENPADGGVVELRVRGEPGQATAGPLPEDAKDKAELVLADIVREHFS